MESKQCQDRFFQPILVHLKIRKIRVTKWGTPKKYLKILIIRIISYLVLIEKNSTERFSDLGKLNLGKLLQGFRLEQIFTMLVSKVVKKTQKKSTTKCFTDLGKLNLPMVVWF